MWITSVDKFLYRVDPSTGRFSTVDVGGRTEGILLAFGQLWVTLPGSNEVLRLDPTNGETLAHVTTGPNPNEIIVGDGVVWVSEQSGASVIAIDPASNEIERFPTGAGPDRMAWSAPNLWVAESGGTSLSIFPTR